MNGVAPETRDANTAFARALVDEWARAGVTDACVAPGSRSTPLALALAADERLRVHVHPDERSASFLALGVAKASRRPVVVLCTSGTAAANFHPAVLEAHHARVPLIVCTADRPPELRDVGAGQTVDQVGLYGRALRWFHDPGAPADVPDAGRVWRAVAARAVISAAGPPAGPVHLNLAFREPLVSSGDPLVPAPGRPDGRPWTTVTRASRAADDATIARVADAVHAVPRGVLVAGAGAGVTPSTVTRFAAAAGWPVLADPLSGARDGSRTVSTYDALLRVGSFAATHRADLVVRVGAPLTSKVATRWLDTAPPHCVVDPDLAWLDPTRAAATLLAVDPETLLDGVAAALGAPRGGAWPASWCDAEGRARGALDRVLDGSEEPFEGRVARDVIAALPGGSTLVVASSMPVRDVEAFAAPRGDVRYLANRGVNGIDGFVSTVLGAALGGAGPVVGLLGDLCFLHDANGLLGATSRAIDATFVVVDNDGGGIFSFLPQAEAAAEHFEELFATPPGIDLAAVARVHGLDVVRVEKASAVGPTVAAAVRAGGVRIVIVRTDRHDNVARHEEAWAAVAAALERG